MDEEKLTDAGHNAFKLGFVQVNLSHLMGQVLTVIDAAEEGEKNKAIKDLIRSKFSERQEWFEKVAWDWSAIRQGSSNALTHLAGGVVPISQLAKKEENKREIPSASS